MQRRRRLCKGSTGTHGIPSLMKTEYRQGNLHSFLGGSCSASLSANAVPDPLSSFILTMPVADSSKDVPAESLDESSVSYKNSDENLFERYEIFSKGSSSTMLVVDIILQFSCKLASSVEPSMSDKNQQERAQRSEFVRELVLSTIFEDML